MAPMACGSPLPCKTRYRTDMLQLYDKLLHFPLFYGMGYNDLAELVAHTKLDFGKYAPNETIINSGDICDRLVFVTNGTLQVTTTSETGDYDMHESINAPFTIQPERLFGLEQRFRSSFIAATDTNTISIGKGEITHLCDNFTIFRINFMNILSAMAQKAQSSLWRQAPRSLEERIALFFAAHCMHPKGKKTLRIRMTSIAEELNDSRLDISHALNSMQERGLLTLHRQRIDIPSIEQLLMNVQR